MWPTRGCGTVGSASRGNPGISGHRVLPLGPAPCSAPEGVVPGNMLCFRGCTTQDAMAWLVGWFCGTQGSMGASGAPEGSAPYDLIGRHRWPAVRNRAKVPEKLPSEPSTGPSTHRERTPPVQLRPGGRPGFGKAHPTSVLTRFGWCSTEGVS